MRTPVLRSGKSIKRRQVVATLAVLGGIVLVVVAGLWASDPKRRAHTAAAVQRGAKEVLADYRTPGRAVNPSEVWIEKSEARLNELQKTNEALQRRVDDLSLRMDQGPPGQDREGRIALRAPIPSLPGEAERPASLFPAPMPSAPAFPKIPLPPPPEIPRAAMPPAVAQGMRAKTTGIGIVEVSFAREKPVTASGVQGAEAKSEPTIRDSLPAGAFGSVVLLNGLDAPTGGVARTNPIPVLMRLLNDGVLPNGFHSRVRSCFVTGAGYGDLSAERAYVRLEMLSCVMRDGRIVSQSVDGYVAGEDGKNGLRGAVISKQGQMIGRALFAGIAGGLGQSIAQSYSRVSVSPLGSVQTVNPDDIARVGIATGVGRALEKIADFYIARANELYPVIEINSARHGEVVLTNTVSLGAAFREAWSQDD